MTNINSFPNVPTISLDEACKCVQSCDILMISGSSLLDELIKKGTSSVWSHIGILFKLNDGTISRIMMMESTEPGGIRAVPLSNYLSNFNGTGKGFAGKMLIARYTNFPIQGISSAATQAIDLLGYPYSIDDIMSIAARIVLKDVVNSVLSSDVSSKTAYICSEYVEACYKAAGVNIPYNTAGYIAPSDFMACDQVVPLYYVAGT